MRKILIIATLFWSFPLEINAQSLDIDTDTVITEPEPMLELSYTRNIRHSSHDTIEFFFSEGADETRMLQTPILRLSENASVRLWQVEANWPLEYGSHAPLYRSAKAYGLLVTVTW